jgi:predicted transposase YdaD
MTIAAQLERKGRKEGLEKGRKEGAFKARRESVINLYNATKFSPEEISRILKLDIAFVRTVLKKEKLI